MPALYAAPGAEDVRLAADQLAARLPSALAPFARIAFNYRWCWTAGGADLFAAIDSDRWQACGRNPVRLLQEAATGALERAAGDRELIRRAYFLEECLAAEASQPPQVDGFDPTRPVAFLCAEYGVHGSLPVYAGGLGVLAGDLVKAASDMGLPFVAVGILYGQGYFRQRIDISGWQNEYWVPSDPPRLPGALVTLDGLEPIQIQIPIRGREVVAQIWRFSIGRVPLFLLDTDIPSNHPVDRWITSRLYVGDELAAEAVAAGASFDEALETARGQTHFTTHTPVPAGNERYSPDEMTRVFAGLDARLGTDWDTLLSLARVDPANREEEPGMTALALRASRTRNGVSLRHGGVARQIWRPLFGADSNDAVPIGHVTNGVHLPTWMAEPVCALLDAHLGEGWEARITEPGTWERIADLPDADLWRARCELRTRLVDYVRERATLDRLARGEDADYVEQAQRAFDPDRLTIGFARRLATYKRLHLMNRDLGRALGLLRGPHPIQILLAGKAHPSDDGAKRVVQQLFGARRAPHVGERIAYLHDYDMHMAAYLVAGCDVWVNLPRPPLEASGTSGMKAAMNGVLNLSVLDGWWAEGYDGSNGWAIPGDEDPDHEAQDARDTGTLLDLLEKDVIPLFYDRDADGVPRGWMQRAKAAIRTAGLQFSARRMLRDYVERAYRVEP
jgi:starch phosphorylase